MNNRRLKVVRITSMFLLELFQQGNVIPDLIIRNGLPADTELVNVRHGWPNLIELLVTSSEFAEVEHGHEIPELAVIVEKFRRPIEAP